MKYSELRKIAFEATDRAKRAEQVTISRLAGPRGEPVRFDPSRVDVIRVAASFRVNEPFALSIRDAQPGQPGWERLCMFKRQAIERIGDLLIESGHLALLPEFEEHRRERLHTADRADGRGGIATLVHELKVYK